MLPMIHNAYKIKYIIDDFEDKQNLYTAIVNKKILPSTILEENPVEGIIIIVG